MSCSRWAGPAGCVRSAASTRRGASAACAPPDTTSPTMCTAAKVRGRRGPGSGVRGVWTGSKLSSCPQTWTSVRVGGTTARRRRWCASTHTEASSVRRWTVLGPPTPPMSRPHLCKLRPPHPAHSAAYWLPGWNILMRSIQASFTGWMSRFNFISQPPPPCAHTHTTVPTVAGKVTVSQVSSGFIEETSRGWQGDGC